MAEKNYSAMKKEDLINLAREMKVWVVASMRKDEIIASIRLAESASKAKSAAPKAQKPETKPAAGKKAAAAKAPAKPQTAAKPKTSVSKIIVEDALATPKAKPKAAEAKPAEKKVERAMAKAVETKPAVEIKSAAPAKAPAQAAPPVFAAPKAPAKVEAKTAQAKPTVKEERAPVTAAPKAAAGKFDISPDVKKFFAAKETSDYGPPSAQPGAGGPALAGRYGETEITAMAKGPGALYVYWEVTPERAEDARSAMGRHWSLLRWMVRIYDVTGGAEGDANALYYDFPVDSGAGALHATLPRAEREYVATIGFMDNTGNYMVIAHSNRVGAPGPEIAGITQEGISALMDVGVGRVSGSPMGLESSSGQWGLLSGAGLSGVGFAAQRGRRMWLNTELTLYGGVDPVDASVFLGERELPLAPGGFFTAKFILRDGVMDLPVKAVWRDNAQMTGGVTVTQVTKEIR